jgi:hypothetical protein
MSGNQRLPLSSSQHCQPSRPCPEYKLPAYYCNFTTNFTTEQSSAHSAAVLRSRLTFYCSAQCPGPAKSWRKVCAGLIQKLHRFIFQNFFEIEHFGCFISKFILPNSHGKPHGVAVEERTAQQACPRSIIRSNFPSATKNCSRHSKKSI